MGTLENTQARIAKLQTQAETPIRKQSSDDLLKIRGLMEKHGITMAAIEAHTGGGKCVRKPVEGSVGNQGLSAAGILTRRTTRGLRGSRVWGA
ncbi:hypothetical protein [Paraburkholderia heleia]|uniref:hypothetical protein n=1 Tax=Paraburkholderia heleia TaxID=634127 RepID=UPI002AB6C481|nr:hypothetical protein [Paraburkholderia heleia]